VLPFTVALQLFTGASGEELGWRGFLLSQLHAKVSERTSAIFMGVVWALWHLPAFFFPGMPQQRMPEAPFLLTVTAFGIFLGLLFFRAHGNLLGTMLAHFSFNLGLAVGGARLGPAFLWTLASIFSVVAVVSAASLSGSAP
jgi:CAAX protease family protein